MAREYIQGRFTPRNPQKYAGDVKNIVYRSGWEANLMTRFDEHPNIILWNSEGLVIPYHSPVDGKMHRYFPDFLIKAKCPDGHIRTILIEVKPHAQTELRVPKRKTRKFINEAATYAINKSKWLAAEKFCKDQGWIFKIVTEKEFNFI